MDHNQQNPSKWVKERVPKALFNSKALFESLLLRHHHWISKRYPPKKS